MSEEKGTSSQEKIKVISPHEGGQSRFVQSNIDFCFFGGCLAGGKEQPLDSKILTPNGWVCMGDIKVGDTVLTPFHNESKVLGVYPQGAKKVYRIKTTDGRICEAGAEHLWAVRTKKQIYKYRRHGEHRNFMVLTTSQLIEGLKEGHAYYIPIPKAQEFSEKEFVIPPYLLGILLGDGCISNMKNENCFVVSNSEEDIIQKIFDISESTRLRTCDKNYNKYFYTPHINEYKKYLRDNGLETWSREKHIPKEYLFGSIEQRKQLLFGLMDTDGSVQKKNVFSFCTTSRQLASDFIYLCRSLGYIASTKEDHRVDKYRSGYCVSIFIQTDDIIFSSKKHLSRYEENYEKYIKDRCYGRTNDHTRIESIEEVGIKQTQCIYIEDEHHLYITDDFMTTHNTFGAILSMSEPALDPNFRAVFFRRTLGEVKSAGGIVDTFKDAFGDIIHVKISDNPRFTFPSGAYCEARQVSDETPNKVTETYRGLQGDCLIFEELTGFEWYTFNYITTRARGRAKWTGKVRATLNPKRSHWTRKFLDWYINPTTGYLIPERDGVVRYFYVKDKTVDSIIWGDTKEEVYNQCREQIDRQMKNMGGDVTYKDMIKSFVFYKGSLAENKSLLENNKGYIGNVASVGETMAKALIEGNFNVDIDEEEDIPLPYEVAETVFSNDPRENGDKWITADLADTGTDNTLILVWNGLHIMDYKIICTSTPAVNVEHLKFMAEKHDIPDNHIIYDGIRAAYVYDHIPEAIGFKSYSRTAGKYGRMYFNLKDECYARLVEVIKRRMISFDDKIANDTYAHIKLKNPISIKTEFIEECSVVKFKNLPGGKKTLLNKKEMNQMLGKGRSMDLLDPIAMRMRPLLQYEYGQELIETEVCREEKKDLDGQMVNVYREDTWC